MKRNVSYRFLPSGIAMMLFFFLPLFAGAQDVCKLSIVGDFEPRCVVTMDKPDPFEELAGELIACQGSTVVYTSLSGTGTEKTVPCLAPNPASSIVYVSGYDGNVEDVAVMDMNGRKLMAFEGADTFDVSAISSGTYIVRVRTRNRDAGEKVYYLKLVKK